MSWLFKRLLERHVELLVVALLTLGAIGLLWLIRYQAEAVRFTVIVLEIVLPAAGGLAAAGLLAEDPALEILLTTPRPSRHTLMERVAIALIVCVFLAAAVNVLALNWGIPLVQARIHQPLMWISPLVFFVGISSAASLLRGRILDGSLAVLAVCGFFLFVTRFILLPCREYQSTACPFALFTPFLTSSQPQTPNWLANRLLWLCLGFLLFLISQRLSAREERLIQAAQLE
jgi:hypothetical protein